MAGHDRLTPQGRRFMREIEKLRKLELRVGFQHGKDQEDDGTDIADVAMWNELGTGTAQTPARPFLRQSVDNNASVISAMCKAQLEGIAEGKNTADDALRAIGAMQVGLIQHTIENGKFEKNAKATIRAKMRRAGRVVTKEEVKNNRKSDTGDTLSKPLIDTGRMRQSVHYVIKEKGGSR